MKFVIYREVTILDSDKKKRVTLVECGQEEIRSVMEGNFRYYSRTGYEAENAFRMAFDKTIEDFKKETIKIP